VKLLASRIALVCLVSLLPQWAHAQVLYAGTSEGDAGSPEARGRIYRIDVGSQEVTLVAQVPESVVGGRDVSGLDFSPDGILYAVTGGSGGPAYLMTVDIDTGNVSIIGEILFPWEDPTTSWSDGGIGALAFDSDGTLFATAWNDPINNGSLLTLDPVGAVVLWDVPMTKRVASCSRSVPQRLPSRTSLSGRMARSTGAPLEAGSVNAASSQSIRLPESSSFFLTQVSVSRGLRRLSI